MPSSEAGDEKASAATARSLDRQIVLEEDEYTEALSHIIARDFFPSLVHLNATHDHLDALRSEDPELIQASQRRLAALPTFTPRRTDVYATPSQTPFGIDVGDTPLRTPRQDDFDSRPAKKRRVAADLSLDAFQARFTSEDNASFLEILDDENKKRKTRHAWAWAAQKRVEEQRDRMIEGRERMLLEPAPLVGVKEKFAIEQPKLVGLITEGDERHDGGPGQDEASLTDEGLGQAEETKKHDLPDGQMIVSMMSSPELTDRPVDVMAPTKDSRPAGVQGWKFKARNALMFQPDADVSPHATSSKVTIETSGAPKTIKHANTRLPDETPVNFFVPPSPSFSRIGAAIAGTPYRPSSELTDSFSLVPNIPSPSPSQLGDAGMKQLMTWGTLDATPRVLPSSKDPADGAGMMPPPSTPFRLADLTPRELISRKLSNSAAKSLRVKASFLSSPGRTSSFSRKPNTSSSGGKGSMAPPTWTPRNSVDSLTPAARRLLDRTLIGGTASSRRADAMGKTAGWEGQSTRERDLARVRWTPSPSTTRREL